MNLIETLECIMSEEPNLTAPRAAQLTHGLWQMNGAVRSELNSYSHCGAAAWAGIKWHRERALNANASQVGQGA